MSVGVFRVRQNSYFARKEACNLPIGPNREGGTQGAQNLIERGEEGMKN